MNLYLTADRIGIPTGGGSVTFQEYSALSFLGPCDILSRDQLACAPGEDPWGWDVSANFKMENKSYQLTHVYAGTFSKTLKRLKENGCKITYTAAAHNIKASIKAHEELGIPFNYPHLTDPVLWEKYLAGYLLADILVCPSLHSADVMRDYGYKGQIRIIPHGCHFPKEEEIKPLPTNFVVGYLGSYGADKNILTLIKAWAKLNYHDATLILAGQDSVSPFVIDLVKKYGGGNVVLKGWVENVSEFYGELSLLAQLSYSEGFGCEVLEALAAGRSVICSDGVGAKDLVTPDVGWQFKAGSVDELASLIDSCKKNPSLLQRAKQCREKAEKFTWDKVRCMYVDMWKGLLEK